MHVKLPLSHTGPPVSEHFRSRSQSPDASFEFARIVEYISFTSHNMLSIDEESRLTFVSPHETVDYLCGFISSSNILLSISADYLRELIIL